ncbi:hypothetical protein QQP08_024154 [Theobroma cacao]|nr:hypothetical protein QQP08_024154 [Theobroma cacao]
MPTISTPCAMTCVLFVYGRMVVLPRKWLHGLPLALWSFGLKEPGCVVGEHRHVRDVGDLELDDDAFLEAMGVVQNFNRKEGS